MWRLALLLLVAGLGGGTVRAQWVDQYTHESGTLDDVLVHGGNLHVVGSFTNLGGTAYTAVIDPSGAIAQLAGLPSDYGKRLVEYQGTLLASVAGDLYALDGTTWNLVWDPPYPAGPMAVHHDTLVVALHAPDDQPRLYRPDGAGWTTYVPDPFLGSIGCLASYGGELYVGGGLTKAGPVYVRGIARWNGSAWHKLGAGVDNGGVARFAAYAGKLIVLGTFTSAGPLAVGGLAWWDGASWGTFGPGPGPTDSGYGGPRMYGAATDGSDLYIAGQFDGVNGVAAEGTARWRNGAWEALSYPGGLAEARRMVFFAQAIWADLRPTYTGLPIVWHLARWETPVTGVGQDEIPAPGILAVSPNPFRGTTTILLDPAPRGLLGASLLDVRGRTVRRLALPSAASGAIRIPWDGRADDGTPVAAGVYFLRVDHVGGRETARILRLR